MIIISNLISSFYNSPGLPAAGRQVDEVALGQRGGRNRIALSMEVGTLGLLRDGRLLVNRVGPVTMPPSGCLASHRNPSYGHPVNNTRLG